MLEQYIKEKLSEKQILLMTHIVIGYPNLKESFELVKTMVENGVDLMELQIPFSEPIADGPVILSANQQALLNGITVEDCFKFAEKVADQFDIPFLFMSYCNIAYKQGFENFARRTASIHLKGAILPDLPPEESDDYVKSMRENGLDPIFLFTPTTSESRLKYIAEYGRGFIYCVARKGVTGENTNFSQDLEEYLARCRAATRLPLALGFGVKNKEDIDFLKGKVEIAVIGSQSLRVLEEKGISAVGKFIKEIR